MKRQNFHKNTQSAHFILSQIFTAFDDFTVKRNLIFATAALPMTVIIGAALGVAVLLLILVMILLLVKR